MRGTAGFRARHQKHVLAAIERLAPEDRAAVRDAISASTRAAIEEALGVAWLPIALDVEVADAVLRGLGAQRAAVFWRETLQQTIDGQAFRVLVEGAFLLFGRTPSALVRWIPQGWAVIYRACGEWSVTLDGEGRAQVRLSTLPPGCLASAGWMLAVGCALEAVLGVAQAAGTVERVRGGAGPAVAEFVITWSAKAQASAPGGG